MRCCKKSIFHQSKTGMKLVTHALMENSLMLLYSLLHSTHVQSWRYKFWKFSRSWQYMWSHWYSTATVVIVVDVLPFVFCNGCSRQPRRWLPQNWKQSLWISATVTRQWASSQTLRVCWCRTTYHHIHSFDTWDNSCLFANCSCQ
jgi:hypothetical protein